MTITPIMLNSNVYQSYVSVAEADAYLAVDSARSEAWAALTNEQKISRLITATRRIDSLTFAGEKTDANQPLKFPRAPALSVPPEIEQATILLAGGNQPILHQTSQNARIRRVKAGTAEVEFSEAQSRVTATIDDPVVLRLLRSFFEAGGQLTPPRAFGGERPTEEEREERILA